jgi:hypothetical protein
MIAPRRLLALAFVTLAAALTGCGATGWSALRESALAPGPPSAARAEALLLAAGDPVEAAAVAEAALAEPGLAPTDRVRALRVLIVASDVLAEPDRPAPHLLPALEALRAAPAPEPAAVRALAAELDRVFGRLDGPPPDDPGLAAFLAAAPFASLPEGHLLLARHRLTAARLTGGPAAVAALAPSLGIVTDWRLSAPWGDAPLVDAFTALGPESRPLRDTETTGAGYLDPRPTSTERFTDGEVLFFELRDRPGTGFAEALVPPAARAAPRVALSFETNRLATLFVDGRPITARADLRAPHETLLLTAALAGAERLTVKFTTHDGLGFFRVIARPAAPDAAPVSPFLEARLSAERPAAITAALLELGRLLGRPLRDHDAATALGERLFAALPAGPVADWLRMRLLSTDPEAPATARAAARKDGLERLLARIPDAPGLRRELARALRDEGRPDLALDGLAGLPGARAALARLELHRERGREAESLAELAGLEAAAPESPRVMQDAVDTLMAFGRTESALESARALETRWPGLGARRLARLLSDTGRPAEAASLLVALHSAEPQDHGHLRAAVAALRLAGDPAAADALVDAFLQRRPADAWALAARAHAHLDCAFAAEPCPAFAAAASAALAVEPSHGPLRALVALAASRPERFDDVPSDGLQRLAGARAGPLAPDGPLAAFPVVTVLDRQHIAVAPDGGTLELRHRIRQAGTRSGADALGDIRVPPGARLLIARTLKADGRVVYPEVTPGKAELSLSELQPGDGVETAWVQTGRVRPDEGGYLTSLGFSHVGVPILDIEHRVETPPGLRLEITARHGAPAPTVTALGDGTLRHDWRGPGPLFPREPRAASSRSYVPHVDLRVLRADAPSAPPPREAGLLAIARAFASRLGAVSAAGPRVRGLLARLRAETGGGPDAAQRLADRLVAHVREALEATETDNQLDTSAEAALAAGRGHRAVVLYAALRAFDADTSFLLCAAEPEGPLPDAEAPFPNANRYHHPLVRFRGRLLDVSRLHNAPTDLAPELHGAECLEPTAAARGILALSRIPRPAAADPAFDLQIDVTLSPAGAARLRIDGRFGGAIASPLRQVWLAQDEVRRRILWEQWLSGLFPGAELVSADVRDAANAAKPMRVRLEVDIPAFATRDGAALVIPRLSAATLLAHDFTSTPDLGDLVAAPARQTPLRLPIHDERVRFDLHAPKGWRFEAPPPLPSELDGVDVRTLEDDGARLRWTRTTRIGPGRVDPEAYPALRDALGRLGAERGRSLRVLPPG